MQPWHVVDGECIKRKFGTEHSALRFSRSRKEFCARSAYMCPVCGAWHLTSVEFSYVDQFPKVDLTPIKTTHPEAEYWLHKIKSNARYSNRKIQKRNKVAKPTD